MPYDLEYHKYLDRSHILPNILKGARTGIITQFLSDFFISLLLYNETIVINDIQISEINSYYASVASGMLAGFLVIYLDPIAVVVFTTVAYGYVFELMEYLKTGEKIELTPVEDVFDIGVSMLICFDPTARSQYIRYNQKRHYIEPTIPRNDRTLTLIILFSVLISTYEFLKKQNKNESQPETQNLIT